MRIAFYEAPNRTEVGAVEVGRSRHRSVANVGIKYGSDNVKTFGVHHTGKDLSGGELTKKRGGAIGMMEGWREVLNEPVRQRVGLLQMSAHYNVER